MASVKHCKRTTTMEIRVQPTQRKKPPPGLPPPLPIPMLCREPSLMVRVGTEPDTQPAHWNDTNAKYAAMYVAVAHALEETLPRAKLGPGNFASDGPTRAESQSGFSARVGPHTAFSRFG